jgi:hypothetical protein
MCKAESKLEAAASKTFFWMLSPAARLHDKRKIGTVVDLSPEGWSALLCVQIKGRDTYCVAFWHAKEGFGFDLHSIFWG